jgi:hypothetical protein
MPELSHVEELYLLENNVEWAGESQPTFHMNISPPSSGQNSKQSKNLARSKQLKMEASIFISHH